LKQVRKGRFLNELGDENIKAQVGTPEFYTRIYAQRAKKIAEKARANLDKLTKDLGDENLAWNESTVELVKMSRAFCMSILVTNFGKELELVKDDRLKRVLRRLASLYALYHLEKDLGEFMEVGILSPSDAEKVHHAVLDLLKQIRPDAVALVDAFNFPDYLLKSSLGRFDGNVYEHMFDQASTHGLNTKEGEEYMQKAFIKHIKPLQSKL
jgi:acyl-CoA oxidase